MRDINPIIMRYLNIILASLAVFMGVIASGQELLPTDSIMTIVDESVQETSCIADTVPIEVVDTVSEQTNTGSALIPAGDFYMLMERNKFRKYNGPDFHFLKNTTNPAVKPYKFLDDQSWGGIPLFLSGIIAKGEKEAFRQDYNNPNTKIRLIKYNFHSEIDNYTQFSGIALTAGLKLAGVEGRSSWPRLFASSLASYAVMAGFVNSIKYTASELRPDFSTHNSWPSGHTATAFVGATILHKEYGLTRSPWYSIAGYTVATATGVMRVLNNRHWISDVLSGAGIGILSTELAYGICDLLFKQKGLLMNDLSYYPDLRESPSFFAISMGVGTGNRNLTVPAFDYGIPDNLKKDLNLYEGPIELKFRASTAVGVEGAWFFCPYVGIGGRLRVKSTPINGWSKFSDIEEKAKQELNLEPIYKNAVKYFGLVIESDHITEFAGDAGVYFSLPFSSLLALGSKLLVGRSVMDDIDINGIFLADRIVHDAEGNLVDSDNMVYCEWDYIDVGASNSMKFGTGLSLTYAHKNSFSWRVFCDYDYTKKTYTATYTPFAFIEDFSHDLREEMIREGWDPVQTFTTSTQKRLHQWVFGGALCVSF